MHDRMPENDVLRQKRAEKVPAKTFAQFRRFLLPISSVFLILSIER